MSDDEVRALERAWRASGSDDAGGAYLAARLRRGDLAAEDVRVLARLGLGAAITFLGDEAPASARLDLEDSELDFGVPGHDRLARVGYLRLWERHLLPRWESANPGDPRGRAFFRSLREAANAHRRVDRAEVMLPGLSDGDAALLHRVFHVHAGKFLTLSATFPPALRALERPAQLRPLHEEMASELLGVELPEGALRDFVQRRILLVACADAPLEVVQRVSSWLDDLSSTRPRPLRVQVDPRYRPEFAGLEPGRRVEVLRPRPRNFVQLVTLRKDPEDWFARHAADDPRISVVHLGEPARAKLEASPEVFLAHFVAKKALDGVLGAAAPRHEPSRGCAFDFCKDKKSLDARILAGAVCRECHELLRRQRGLEKEHLTALLHILAAARERMLAAR